MMNYEVKLSTFQGPLDLLLHLIERAELDIKDIFLSQITNQYLNYMKQTDELDMETASEFLSMAATLVYIKSRSLLPCPPREDCGEEAEDPETALLRQLKEYKAFKEASAQLQVLMEDASARFTKLPEELFLPEPEIQWTKGVPEELYAAFCELLYRTREEPQLHPLNEVQAERFTIRAESARLRSLLRERSSVGFMELVEPKTPRIQLIVVFLSLLEMIARGEVSVNQARPFAPITVRVVQLINDDEDLDYMDE